MRALFEACKGISAADVAEQAGLSLQSRGRRAWTCCPLHGENTASLMFDDAGRWHCFGCEQGGDAVALYAALYHAPMGEAAKQLAARYGLSCEGVHAWEPISAPPAQRLQEMLEGWYWREWHRACRLKHAAQARIDTAYAQGGLSALSYPTGFYEWVAAHAAAERRLDQLLHADLYERVDMMLEELNEHAQAG